LANSNQRSAVVACLAGMGTASVAPSDKATISTTIITALSDAAGKEAAVDALTSMLVAAGQCASAMDNIPAVLIQRYTALLKEKDDVKKRLAIDSMNIAFTKETISQSAALAPQLINIAKAIAQKPTNLGLGAGALRMLARVAAVDSSVGMLCI